MGSREGSVDKSMDGIIVELKEEMILVGITLSLDGLIDASFFINFGDVVDLVVGNGNFYRITKGIVDGQVNGLDEYINKGIITGEKDVVRDIQML